MLKSAVQEGLIQNWKGKYDEKSIINNYSIINNFIIPYAYVCQRNGTYDMMASQLQMMREEGLLHDVKLYSDDDGFYAIVNDSVIPLAPYSQVKDMKSLKAKSADDNTDLISVNILEPVMHISADMYLPADNVVRKIKEIIAKTFAFKTNEIKWDTYVVFAGIFA